MLVSLHRQIYACWVMEANICLAKPPTRSLSFNTGTGQVFEGSLVRKAYHFASVRYLLLYARPKSILSPVIRSRLKM